jgi:sec-independent protein translocase protein TatA
MLLFFDVSGGEIVVILLFVLIFFGSKKIPEMARGLGKGMREIRDASDAIKREIQHESNKMRDELVEIGRSIPESVEKQDESSGEQSEPEEKKTEIEHSSTVPSQKDEDTSIDLPKPHPGSMPRNV